MRRTLFILLVVAMVFGSVSVALAATTGNNETATWNPPGPTYRAPGAAAGQTRGTEANWAPGDPSPHVGYASNTNKCEVCHSPHGAGDGSTSYKLLYGTTSATGDQAACEYCHVTGGLSIASVYVEVAGNVEGGHDLETMTNGVPDSDWATANVALSCSNCHSVHGANTIGAGTYILKEKPTWNSVASTEASATDQTEFCFSCHNENLDRTKNGASHVMTATLTGLADSVSTDCDDCHAAPKSTGTVGLNAIAKWPHQSYSIVGLGLGSSATSVTSQDNMDDHCLVCHSGVGTDY
jgi:hypothetical protein